MWRSPPPRMETVAPAGPPRPCVYCLRRCFGGEKAGAAPEQAAGPDPPGLRGGWRGGQGTHARVCVCVRLRGEGKDFLVVCRVGAASGQEGTSEPRLEDGSQPTPPTPPSPRCQCYDMCSALLFSLTTRALYLPGWPSLIKTLDLHAGDQTVYLLLFLLHLRFTSCGPGPGLQGR